MSFTDCDKELINCQKSHWQGKFISNPEMFGQEPSQPAKETAELFQKNAVKKMLELGGGHGRDTLFFGGLAFDVTVLDYCTAGISAIKQKAQEQGIANIKTLQHDIRNPLPFRDNSFDGCFSHMLFCMALTTNELEFLSSEILRVLKPGGINVYTVRHTGDAHYGNGMHRGEDMYEVGGFIVHFFTKNKVKHLSKGYEIISLEEFDEGGLPRKLYKVTLRKPD